MNVFITGGAGFIGSNVARYFLDRGHAVVLYDNLSTGHRENIPDSPRARFIQGDILDFRSLAKAMEGCEALCHLAASVGNLRSLESPQKDSEINVLGTLNALNAARQNGIEKFVYSSSAGIFGELKKLPIDEEHPTSPDSPYGVSKLAGELHALCFSKLYGIDAVCLRYFNVYGPGQRFDAYGNVIPIFATRKKKREKLTIYGDGEQTRDFIHVFDIAQANYLAATRENVAGAYNIGTGKALTVNALADLLDRVAGFPSERDHQPPRPGEVKHSLASIEKAKRVLGFEPKEEIENGLRGYWEWFNRAS